MMSTDQLQSSPRLRYFYHYLGGHATAVWRRAQLFRPGIRLASANCYVTWNSSWTAPAQLTSRQCCSLSNVAASWAGGYIADWGVCWNNRGDGNQYIITQNYSQYIEKLQMPFYSWCLTDINAFWNRCKALKCIMRAHQKPLIGLRNMLYIMTERNLK